MPAPNGVQFAVGVWQHVVVVFDGAGEPMGLFWNGVKQQPNDPTGALRRLK